MNQPKCGLKHSQISPRFGRAHRAWNNAFCTSELWISGKPPGIGGKPC
jgi:hypothetical protein